MAFGRVKLLDNVGDTVTGAWFYVGVSRPPYTFYITATAGTVRLDSSPNAFIGNVLGSTLTPPVTAVSFVEFGDRREHPTPVNVALTGLVDGEIAVIHHKIEAIRALTDGSGVAVTVWLVFSDKN